jgi:predicted nucleic acid-binding protein
VIVADVNLLVYLLVRGLFTAAAERALRRDRRWVAPRSHRSELLNVLATNVRAGFVRADTFDGLWRRAHRTVATPPDPDPSTVLSLSVKSSIATYDCEYVAMARQRHLKFVTNDGPAMRAFPDVAVSLEDFAAGR